MWYIQCNKHPVWGLMPTKIVMLWGWFIVVFFCTENDHKAMDVGVPSKKSEKTISFHVLHPAFGQHLAFTAKAWQRTLLEQGYLDPRGQRLQVSWQHGSGTWPVWWSMWMTPRNHCWWASPRLIFSKKCETYDSCAKFMIKTGANLTSCVLV